MINEEKVKIMTKLAMYDRARAENIFLSVDITEVIILAGTD